MKTLIERLENWGACRRGQSSIDMPDVLRIDLAWQKLPDGHRNILMWTFSHQIDPVEICRKLVIPFAQARTEFVTRLGAAEEALQNLLGETKPHKIETKQSENALKEIFSHETAQNRNDAGW
jgi:hypothetical protein